MNAAIKLGALARACVSVYVCMMHVVSLYV